MRGVLELASAGGLSSTHLMFLDQLAESIGIVINTLEAKTRTEDLLAQSQSLAHELQSRQLELQHTNQALQEKARQVALTSKYKSEFLANMSHELRTPLNSLLILSEQLSRNPEGNLSARQVEFAKTIHSSGNDLLMLINDILDLSKIESGTVVVEPSEWRISDLQRYLERNFRHVAEARGVTFRVDSRLRPSVAMRTDIKRLQQILKNLLSNAFKFTQRGTVRLAIEEAREGWTAGHASLQRARRVIAFAVSDTGIGISADKQQIIFDAFQQADGSTSRKYGGTGLGLAISRELSRLLGGEIRLSSVPGQGSTFTLYLPLRHRVLRTAAPAPRRDRPLAAGGNAGQRLAATRATLAAVDEAWPAPLPDDRDRLRPADAVLLVAEGDPESARALTEAARGRGFKVVATPSGAAALAWASLRQPSAIVLGAHLSDMDGSRLLDRLKHDLMLRHLPVCQVAPWAPGPSAGPDGSGLSVAAPSLEGVMACLPAGAGPDAAGAMLERLRAYVVRRQRRVLIALKELALQRELLALLEDDLIQATVTRSAERLVAMLGRDAFDAVVLDAAWLAADSERLRAALCEPRSLSLQALPGPMPVLVHGCGGAFPWPADWNPACLAIHAAGDLTALFDRTVLALHHPVPRLPEERRALLQAHRDAGRPLTGKRVLIVDDDMRNIFALASVLEAHGMDIVWADNGRDAIDRVAHDPQVAVVLMDIMMPELDGLATMREIRQRPRGRDLPLIAVTAKAMKGDRERCIEAGAWDYLSKPVNPHELLTALRAWVQP